MSRRVSWFLFWSFIWDFLLGLIIVAPPILWRLAAVTGKLETMNAQEYHEWRDGPQIYCAIVAALARHVLSIFSPLHPFVEKIAKFASLEWCLEEMLGSAPRSLMGALMSKSLWRKLSLISSPDPARQPPMPTESAANEQVPPHPPRQEPGNQLLGGGHILRRPSAPQTSLSTASPELRRAPQGTGRLLDLQNLTTVQPSESRLQDTVPPSGTFDQEHNLHVASETKQSPTTASDKQSIGLEERKSTTDQLEETTSHQQEESTSNQQQQSRSNQNQERTSTQQEQQIPSEIFISSTEVNSSAIATVAGAQKPTTLRNGMQPLRDAQIADSGNASDSPHQVMDTLEPLSELKHTSVEGSGTTQHPDITTSEGDLSAADEGNTGNTTTLQPCPEIQPVNANLSGDSNDPERRLSVLTVDPFVADLAAADSSHTAQTLRNPSTVPTDDEVGLSVGSVETHPGNVPSPPSSDQATADGVGANRDASFGMDPPVSGFKGLVGRAAGIFKTTTSYTKDEIIGMAAQDYSLEHLKNGIAVDEFNQRIKQWKEFEDSIVRAEMPFRFPDPLDYGEEWRVFYALQLWYYEQWHREKKKKKENGSFPPGYKTLFNRNEDEIRNRCLPVVFGGRR